MIAFFKLNVPNTLNTSPLITNNIKTHSETLAARLIG